MSEHQAEVLWVRDGESFTDGKYSRVHVWRFDGGVEISVSASPSVVPSPYSSEECLDPEEAFIASISSCHMLFFLSIAAKKGYVVNSYKDSAIGTLAMNNNKYSITNVKLRPVIIFEGNCQPDRKAISEIHNESHDKCFIANSIKTHIEILMQSLG